MFLPLSKGVPQGSTLDNGLFTIDINNITSSVTNFKTHLYADDTVLYCWAKVAHKAIPILQQAFDKIKGSLFNLKLVLSAIKTKLMIFTRAKYTPDQNFKTSCKITRIYILHCWILKRF